MDSIATRVIVTVIFGVLICAFTGAGLYGLFGDREGSRGDRVGGAAICLLLIAALAFGIAYVWS